MTAEEWERVEKYVLESEGRCWLSGNPEEGYCVEFSNGKQFRGVMHPQAFLEMWESE